MGPDTAKQIMGNSGTQTQTEPLNLKHSHLGDLLAVSICAGDDDSPKRAGSS